MSAGPRLNRRSSIGRCIQRQLTFFDGRAMTRVTVWRHEMVESKKRAALVTQMIRAWLWVSGLRRRLRAMILMTTTMEMAPVISAMLWMTLRQLRNASRLVQTMSATVRVSTVTCPTRRRQTLETWW
ncbi:hypothetical protein JG687_00018325 [Phytophthora cactorum]|uniref:Uncharacterized protein n=1 Tax=Phytophthora cactorum TaxID=29920 RepID=A0A8T1TQ38_9STRA|nr:hypothetical protein JG687_00018325 [Phytophthora cactorum]